MSSSHLENLVKIGQLKAEPYNEREYEGHLEIDQQLLQELLIAAQRIYDILKNQMS